MKTMWFYLKKNIWNLQKKCADRWLLNASVGFDLVLCHLSGSKLQPWRSFVSFQQSFVRNAAVAVQLWPSTFLAQCWCIRVKQTCLWAWYRPSKPLTFSSMIVTTSGSPPTTLPRSGNKVGTLIRDSITHIIWELKIHFKANSLIKMF